MKFQSVDIEGIFNAQRVSTLPPWNIQTDVARIVYVLDEKSFYYGTSEGWTRFTSNGMNPVLVIENYNAKDQDLCLVDTRNGPVTITLPAQPKMGSVIMFIDSAGTFESNPCTITPNGKYIQRLAKDFILDINDFVGSLTYDPLTSSWKVSIDGVAQVVGNTTIFAHKTVIVADNINATGGQQQFTIPWDYNPEHDNISVSVQGVQQYHFEKTNKNSITLPELIPAGTEVQICSIPYEGSFNIERLITIDLIERDYLKTKDIFPYILEHDGKGSGLDADKLDGISSEDFLLTKDLLSEIRKIDGTGSGINADRLDGFDTTQIGPLPNSVVVTDENGTINRKLLPFGRGGLELVQVFDIPEGTAAIDITNLNSKTGYLIKGFNIGPSTNDVRLAVGVYNETEKKWAEGFANWTCSYTTATSSGLRDFNTNSDMTIARHVRTVDGGVNFEIYVDGFSALTDNNLVYRTKTVKSSVSFTGFGAEGASLYEAVGTLPKYWNVYSAIRLYFSPEGSTNISSMAANGKICVYRWIDDFEGFSLPPDISGYKIYIKEGQHNVEELTQNLRSITTNYPECVIKNSNIDVNTLTQLLLTDRNRTYPDFIIKDTHLTVEDFGETAILDRDFTVQESQMTAIDCNNFLQLTRTSYNYGDFVLYPKSYNCTELKDVLTTNRTTNEIPEFDLKDTHYTIEDFGEKAPRIRVNDSALTIEQLKLTLENNKDVDFGDVSVRINQYNIEAIRNLLSKDWSTDSIPEFRLVDNSYTIADLLNEDAPRLYVKDTNITIANLESNVMRNAIFDDFSIQNRQLNVSELEALVSTDISTNEIPEFRLIDNAYRVSDLSGTKESRLYIRNGNITVASLKSDEMQDADYDDFIVKANQLNVAALENLVSKDWSISNDDFTLIDNSYTTSYIEENTVSRLYIRNGQMTMTSLENEYHNVDYDDYSVIASSYRMTNIDNLNNNTSFSTSDFEVKNRQMKMDDVD